VQDEQARFNAACARRGPAPLQTAAGLQLVWQVTPDWWYVCGPDDLTASSLPGRNDEAWAALMAGVGEPRHPLLVKRLLSCNGRRRPWETLCTVPFRASDTRGSWPRACCAPECG